MTWDLLVRRDDLARAELRDAPDLEPAEGEAVLRVDRVGLTANNVTYAVFGEAMHYWDFFPADDGWGRVPLWGFAEVTRSRAEGVAEGTRVFGYLPPSSHLVVRPGRVRGASFVDTSEHRAALPSPYNAYAAVTDDPAYERDREDLQVLYRPLFFTSFMLADFLTDNGRFGADSVVVSSASSKTAYGTAFELRQGSDRPRLVGLTSPGNVAFTEGLGWYDQVLSYDDVADLVQSPTAYVDVAGSAALRTAVHEHLGDLLVHDAVVGAAHHTEQGDTGRLPGARPAFFFAPDQIRKRSQDWGTAGLDERFGAAWRSFAPAVEPHVDVQVGSGPGDLLTDWQQVLAGTSPPRAGLVVQL